MQCKFQEDGVVSKGLRMRISVSIFLFSVLILWSGWGKAASVVPLDPQRLFSYGSGPVEVFIFTDYFCPPCRSIESHMEEALESLHRLGVKITFVDMPFYPLTPLYASYFLYGAKAAEEFTDVLRVRRALFDIAQLKTVDSDAELVRRLKEKQIRISLLDLGPVFDQWSGIIKRFSVKSTPTCVVTRPGQEMQVLNGSVDIPQGIDRLIQDLSQISQTPKEVP